MSDQKLTIEDLEPSIRQISREIAELGDPDSKFYKELGDDAAQWSDVIVEGLDACCASHLAEGLANMQMQLLIAAKLCRNVGCTDHLRHEFMEEMANIIHKIMGDKIRDFMIEIMLEERTN